MLDQEIKTIADLAETAARSYDEHQAAVAEVREATRAVMAQLRVAVAPALPALLSKIERRRYVFTDGRTQSEQHVDHFDTRGVPVAFAPDRTQHGGVRLWYTEAGEFVRLLRGPYDAPDHGALRKVGIEGTLEPLTDEDAVKHFGLATIVQGFMEALVRQTRRKDAAVELRARAARLRELLNGL